MRQTMAESGFLANEFKIVGLGHSKSPGALYKFLNAVLLLIAEILI